MPRLAGLRHALPVLALCALSVGACSSHGGAPDAGPPAVLDETPLPAPAGHLGDLFLPTPGATWDKARGLIGAPALFLPKGFSALVATLVGLPITYSAEIDDAVPVIGAAARQGQGPVAFAIGVHVKAGDRFVDQLTRGEGARFNAAVDPATHVTLLTDKVAPRARSSRSASSATTCSSPVSRPTCTRSGPTWCAPSAAPPAPKEDVALEIPEKALAGPVLDEVRDASRKERGRGRGAPPALGDARHGLHGLRRQRARAARPRFERRPSYMAASR